MIWVLQLMQLLLVFLQTRKGPRRVMLNEVLVVMSGIAPGIHAMRVANGSERSEGAAMSDEMLLVFTRGEEMCFEAIPGSILQIYACLQAMKGGSSVNKVALGSIITSALTTGFSAATISFE